MLYKNKFSKGPGNTEQTDSAFIIETAAFVFLMAACACGLVYGLIQLIAMISENVMINMQP